MKAMTIKGIDENVYKNFKSACAEDGIDMKASVLDHMGNIRSGRTLMQMQYQIINGLKEEFSAGELSMLLDIFNATALTPGIFGPHITAQVEDSFNEYPDMYEKKWSIDKKAMLKDRKSVV